MSVRLSLLVLPRSLVRRFLLHLVFLPVLISSSLAQSDELREGAQQLISRLQEGQLADMQQLVEGVAEFAKN